MNKKDLYRIYRNMKERVDDGILTIEDVMGFDDVIRPLIKTDLSIAGLVGSLYGYVMRISTQTEFSDEGKRERWMTKTSECKTIISKSILKRMRGLIGDIMDELDYAI